jgi:hypothetical protein
MSYSKTIGRLGMLAVGLGIGAAAATSGIASADSTDVDAATFDPSVLIDDPAPGVSGLNLAISIDGNPMFQSGTATADSGNDDIAIAYGDGATATSGATANPGAFDYAFADGNDAEAAAGVGNDDSAIAIGSASTAAAGSGDGDTGFADGAGTTAVAGGEYTPGTDPTLEVAGNDMYASAFGSDDFAAAEAEIGGMSATSTGDIATVIGDGSGAFAGVGSDDFAAALADSLTSTATGGSFLFDLMPSL